MVTGINLLYYPDYHLPMVQKKTILAFFPAALAAIPDRLALQFTN